MPVVDVRVVWMPVHELRVLVPVHMRFLAIPFWPVPVPVMSIVNVVMLMLHRLVQVLVLVPLADVQPHAGNHEGSGRPE
jgi:hypothetical protein